MKKVALVVLASLLAVIVAACGSETTTSSSSTSKDDKVLTEVVKANKDVKSLTQDAKVHTEITVSQGEQKQVQKVDMSTKMDVINEPFTAYQEIEMTVPSEGEQIIKQYITQEGIYSNVNGEWVTVPEEVNEQLKASLKESANLESQMKQFNTVSKYLKLKEEKDQFILAADIPGDKVKELAQSVLEKASSGNSETLAAMEQLDIKSMNVEYQVDKKTYYLEGAVIAMVMGVKEEDQTVDMKVNMDSKFSNINGVKEIVVPKEALNSGK
ncbi:DUF6612 family protein [Bacillus massiliigorillae]|uniref:DUF6612 family protein n=1 Tax=Bacillus massiliigorillae TaxID=1243664 RepID=UPI0003A687DF|nr:DUF6612 family protein [Bacillus massiliigorillae]